MNGIIFVEKDIEVSLKNKVPPVGIELATDWFTSLMFILLCQVTSVEKIYN